MHTRFVPLLFFALLLSASSVAPAPAQDEPERDGKWHYQRHCAGCHNDNGDGKGPTITALGLQARDFKAGGFAFGDSREQIFKTLSTGIPGRSPMPSFAGVMDEDERWLVVDYVRTLMPPRKDESPRNTVMMVGNKPVLARGKLPPIAEGAKETTRGLLIGDPSGMTFEYDLDGVRLLGVRLGQFADREDWGDRGGAYLKPLGKLVYSFQNATLEPRIVSGPPELDPRNLKRVVRSTWARAGRAGLSYVVQDQAGRSLCTVDESVRAELLSVGAGFTRRFQVVLSEGVSSCPLWLSAAREEQWRPNAPPQSSESSARRSQTWWTCSLGEQGVECVLPRSRNEITMSHHAREFVLLIHGRAGAPLMLESTTVRVPAFTPELGEQLAKELGQ